MKFLFALLMSLLSLPVLAQDAPATQPTTSTTKSKKVIEIPANVRVDRDVSYLPSDRKEKADVYSPADIQPGQTLNGVLIMHGGGFNDGDKGRNREISIGVHLAQNGYVGVSINYKLRVKDQVSWPQCLYDAKTAIRWMKKNADKLHIDPEKVGVIGCSAGGNMAAMLALTRPEDGLEPKEPYGDVSSSVTCAIDLYGAVDLMTYHDMKMFNKTREEAPELYKKASPTSYARKDGAPLLLIHGTADATVPVTQSQMLADLLKSVGATYELEIIPDAPHTFDLQPKQKDLRPLVTGFLDKYLKNHHP